MLLIVWLGILARSRRASFVLRIVNFVAHVPLTRGRPGRWSTATLVARLTCHTGVNRTTGIGRVVRCWYASYGG